MHNNEYMCLWMNLKEIQFHDFGIWILTELAYLWSNEQELFLKDKNKRTQGLQRYNADEREEISSDAAGALYLHSFSDTLIVWYIGLICSGTLFVSDSQSSYWIKGDICSVRGSVHFRTQRFGLQLRGPGRIRTRSAWSRPVSGSKCKADMHAFGVSNSPIQHSCHSTYELNWTEILTNDCWLVDASSRLRYSHQQATMCVRSILLGHGVTVSSLMCFRMNEWMICLGMTWLSRRLTAGLCHVQKKKQRISRVSTNLTPQLRISSFHLSDFVSAFNLVMNTALKM